MIFHLWMLPQPAALCLAQEMPCPTARRPLTGPAAGAAAAAAAAVKVCLLKVPSRADGITRFSCPQLKPYLVLRVCEILLIKLKLRPRMNHPSAACTCWVQRANGPAMALGRRRQERAAVRCFCGTPPEGMSLLPLHEGRLPMRKGPA